MKNKKLFAILTLVCFMFTLMPVAAFAAPTASTIEADASSFLAVDGDDTLKLDVAKTTGAAFNYDLNDAGEDPVTAGGDFLIWAENASGNVTSALDDSTLTGAYEKLDNVYYYTAPKANGEVTLKFLRSGEYTVYAAEVPSDKVTVDSVDDLAKFDCEFSVITVKSSTTDAADYDAAIKLPTMADFGAKTDADEEFTNKYDNVVPNNVMSDKIYVNFYDADGKALKNETVYIEANSAAIEVNKDSDVTNSQGQIDFKVAASIEGNYEVILTVDDVTWTLIVNVGTTDAAYIETAKQPKAPQALDANLAGVAFEITDINGNEVKDFDNGMNGIEDNAKDGKYIVFTEKPADSDLEDKDLTLKYDTTDGEWDLVVADEMDAEGDYAVKVILDNGAYATAEWTVKKFGTPVKMYFSAGVPAQVELGRALIPTVKFVDANGVEKSAKTSDITIAVNGYAVEYVDDEYMIDKDGDGVPETTVYTYENGYIKLKADEKYVGSEVTLTAISDKYEMTCTGTVTIVEVAGIAFDHDALEVNVNNKVDYFLADAAGKMVRVNSNAATVKYIVIDKPEGAKVSVRETEALSNSEGQFAITSDTVGNVTVQVIASVELDVNGVGVNEYYTGVVVLPIGTDGTGDVVVMSIGSNYIVLNNEIKEIPAPAMIKDARTFVPFRAIGEAFGAEVAWDAATQSVTAELNGVVVVLTIGSPVYTVNGVEMTADVAPFIAGDGYTMVPARLIAEAFGGKVLFTTDANGGVADVLFLM